MTAACYVVDVSRSPALVQRRQMQRRAFIMLLASTAAGWPLAARAQERQRLPVIGILTSGGLAGRFGQLVTAFQQGLNETGHFPVADGVNVGMEFRFAAGQFDRLPALAADLVRREVAVIAANDMPSARAAQAATTTIPIIWLGYQGSTAESFRNAGIYVGRILNGERLANLPVIQLPR